nr:MAG: hypothetical protein KVP17_005146 [Porospora cf. gigantea B]
MLDSAEDVEDDCLDYPGCDYVGESSGGKCVPEEGESITTCSKQTSKAACRAADDCEWQPTKRGVCENAASCVSLSVEECKDSTWCHLQGGSCNKVNADLRRSVVSEGRKFWEKILSSTISY